MTATTDLQAIYNEDRAAAYLDKRIKDSLPTSVDVMDHYMNLLTHKLTKAEVYAMCEDHNISTPDTLPHAVTRLYGCMNCEWQGTQKCPYCYTYKRKGQAPHGGICMKRKVWLCRLGGDWTTRPKLAEWQERFFKNRLAVETEKDLQRKEQYQAQLDKLKLDKKSTPEEIALLRDYTAEAKRDWIELMKILIPAEGRQVEREMPKKVEITSKSTISIQDIQNAVKDYKEGKVLDADFEVIEDENE